MPRTPQTLIGNATISAASLFSVAVILYSLFLLFVGEQMTILHPGEITGTVLYQPHLGAFMPLTAAALLLSGLVTRKLWIAWTG